MGKLCPCCVNGKSSDFNIGNSSLFWIKEKSCKGSCMHMEKFCPLYVNGKSFNIQVENFSPIWLKGKSPICKMEESTHFVSMGSITKSILGRSAHFWIYGNSFDMQIEKLCPSCCYWEGQFWYSDYQILSMKIQKLFPKGFDWKSFPISKSCPKLLFLQNLKPSRYDKLFP